MVVRWSIELCLPCYSIIASAISRHQRALTSVCDESFKVVFNFYFVWLPFFLEKVFLLDSGTPHTSGFLPHMSTSPWLPSVLSIDPNPYSSLVVYACFMSRSLTIPPLPSTTSPHDLCPPATHVCFQTVDCASCLRVFCVLFSFFPWNLSHACISLCLSVFQF